MSTVITPTDAQPGARRPARARRTTGFLVYVAPAAMFAILAVATPQILSRTGVMSLLVLSAILGIAAVGQTWAVMIGGIDLSIPATIGMANVLMTTLYGQGVPVAAILPAILALSILIGVVNGLLSSLFGLHPLIVTLGVASVITGAILVGTNGNTGGTVPAFLTEAVSPGGSLFGLPIPAALAIWIVIAAIVVVVQRRSVLGRQIYALGSNPRAAHLALVRPTWVRVAVYTVGAVCAAIAGCLLAGFSGGAAVNIGAPYLFSTITAVVVGGTSLLGGSGGYARTIAGVLVTTEFTTLLVGFKVGANLQQVMLGIAVLALITLYGRDRSVADRL
jgi:ribose transport system permease protein